jgi:DNA-directed RNA polymerase specialized sigma subunit
MPDSANQGPTAPNQPFMLSPLRPTNKPVQRGQDKPSALDEKWAQWNKSKRDDHLSELMQAADPIISKAITSYAPNSSPAVRSAAKVLAKGAFETYDPKKNTKLQTHLYIQLQPLQRETQAYDTMHVPERVRFDIRHVNEAHNRFVEENGQEPSDGELADYTGLSQSRLAHIRKFDKAIIGESQMLPEDDDNDMSMPATNRGQTAWREMVYMELNDKDKLVYDLKTGRNGRVPMGVNEIAAKLKLSPGAISQRLAKIDHQISEGSQYEKTL